MLFYLYIYFMILLFILMFLGGLFLLINNIIIFFEFEFMKILSIEFHYLLMFDWISMLFMSIVLLISFSVIFYSLEYMKEDYNISRFIMLVIMFIISMMFLIISPNLVSILLGWDGLGLISYCLIIYYQNEKSFNCGMVTILINRIGDIMLLMLISFMLSLGNWNFLNLNNCSFEMMFLLMLASFTKSAQIPFSSWLPMAMAAPTPVSSLVHSSTLVTAGVYLLIRFNYLMLQFLNLMNLIMFISIMTLFMSGMSANFEYDFKKIIALSTLSQLGVMIFSLKMNFIKMTLFHLMMHALFKSMLFMCAGVFIHNFLNNQDIRFIGLISLIMPSVSMIFNCSSLALMGLPFLSGFFSKDLILEMFLMNIFNKFIFFLLFISMGFTLMYSLRLMYYSFVLMPKMVLNLNFNLFKNKMFYSMLILYFFTIIMGLIFSWLMFSVKNLIYLNLSMKILIYKFLFLSLIMFIFFVKKINNLKKNYMMFFYSMWYLSFIHKMINFFFLKNIYKFMYLDYFWIESFSLNFYKKLINKIIYYDYSKFFYYIFFLMNYFLIYMLIF